MTDTAIVVKEVNDEQKVGSVIGQCKWFNDKLGYGFVTIQDGEEKGKDIFIHHSGIRPLNSNYKTLKKGEYVNFDIVSGENGPQGVNITGILGGTLMCDVLPSYRFQPQTDYVNSPPPPPQTPFSQFEYTPGFTPVRGRNKRRPDGPPRNPYPYV